MRATKSRLVLVLHLIDRLAFIYLRTTQKGSTDGKGLGRDVVRSPPVSSQSLLILILSRLASQTFAPYREKKTYCRVFKRTSIIYTMYPFLLSFVISGFDCIFKLLVKLLISDVIPMLLLLLLLLLFVLLLLI